MSLSRKFKKLYAQIPEFECKPGCSDCCGPVPWAKWEWLRTPVHKLVTNGKINCPYAVDGRCEVYDYRPLTCRMFGAGEHKFLECPHGCGPAKKLSPERQKEIMEQYYKLMDL